MAVTLLLAEAVELDGTKIAILALSAFVAGVINAVAGGGTLLTFPALLTVMGELSANVTSTVALLPGSIASAWGYRRDWQLVRRSLYLLLPPSILGGLVGSICLLEFPERIFKALVPWLVLLAATLFLIQKPLSRYVSASLEAAPSRRMQVVVVFFQFLVATYGGYFGAGIGILMLSSLGFMGLGSIHRMNGVKTVLAAAINLVSVVVFALYSTKRQLIIWPVVLPMALSAIVGGYLGAHFGRKLPTQLMRGIVIAIGFSVAAFYFLN